MSRPFDFFRYQNGVLSADGVSLKKIADRTGTPVYVYSAEAFLTPLRELQKGLAPIDHLICFAVKANSNLAVLKLLGRAGAGMDLVSGGELFRALRAGIPAERIVFSGVGKTPAEMENALRKGLCSFNVESTAELALLSAIARRAGRRAPVALRFNPDVNAKTHPYISTGLKKNKFGIERKEILAVARNLKKYPGIDFKGISIHIGSQLLSLSPLNDAFGRVRALVDELNGILPEPLRFVDLGGGVGITYKNERAPSLAKYCALVLRNFGPRAGLKHPLRVLIEPGRAISGNAGVLLTEVLYRKQRGQKDFVVVDAGMTELFRPALYGSYHGIVPVRQALARDGGDKADIVGPVCETTDCFATQRPLSRRVDGGELLAFLSAGAYGFTMSSNYNTRPRPPEVLVRDGSFKIVRKRERYDDLIRGERG